MSERWVWLSCLLVLLPFNSIADAQNDRDWTGFRGSQGTGSIHPRSLLATSERVSLEVAWKHRLGSGYSGIAIANDRLVTTCTREDRDWLICLDAETGAEHWQVALGKKHAGRDGSFDGPISTPVISDQTVIALSAFGKLLAVDLHDGKVHWSLELAERPVAAPKPLYGFATSPVVYKDNVILLSGAKDAFAIGFDINSGRLKWQAGIDKVEYQSAVLAELFGQTVVVAAGNTKLFGFDPESGRVLFEIEHGGNGPRGAFSIVPVQVAENRIFIANDDRASCLFQVNRTEGKYSLERVFETRSIRNSYGVPVFHNGILFGYNNRVFTAVDPQTGKTKWQSRQPGDGFHIGVDDHVIIATKKGSISISRTSDSGFEEVDSLKIFDDLVWSLPSFSDNAVFIRSLNEIARVQFTQPEEARSVENLATSDLPMSTSFQKFIDSIRGERDPQIRKQKIEGFISKHPESPFIEDGIAHFYYRGAAKDVAVGSSLFGARQEKKMNRIGDFFFCSLPLEADQRADYSYFIDFESNADPRNPNPSFDSSIYVDNMEIRVATTTEFDVVKMSSFAMPAWKPAPFLKRLQDRSESRMKGSIVKFEIDSPSNPFDKGLLLEADPRLPNAIYLPPGYEQGDLRYPVVYVHGPDAREAGQFDRVVDILIDQRQIRPCILVFLPIDIGHPNLIQYPAFVAEQIIPEIDRRFRTLAGRENRSNYATGFLAPLAMLVAAENRDLFSATAVQSPFVFGNSAEAVFARFAKIDQPFRFYCDWGNFDLFNPDENWDMREIGSRIMKQMRSNVRVSVRGGMANDTTGWKSWQSRLDRVLLTLVGPPK